MGRGCNLEGIGIAYIGNSSLGFLNPLNPQPSIIISSSLIETAAPNLFIIFIVDLTSSPGEIFLSEDLPEAIDEKITAR